MSGFSMKIDVPGIEEIRKDFQRMDREFKKEVKKEVRHATNWMRDQIRDGTPVKEGTLKKNIKTSVRGFTGMVVVNEDGWYWVVIEFGSDARGIKGTLYTQKIIERDRPTAQNMIVAGVDRVING